MNFFITFHCASLRSIHPIYIPTFCVQVLFMRWLLVTCHCLGRRRWLHSVIDKLPDADDGQHDKRARKESSSARRGSLRAERGGHREVTPRAYRFVPRG